VLGLASIFFYPMHDEKWNGLRTTSRRSRNFNTSWLHVQ
jgi:hypothetical protein